VADAFAHGLCRAVVTLHRLFGASAGATRKPCARLAVIGRGDHWTSVLTCCFTTQGAKWVVVITIKAEVAVLAVAIAVCINAIVDWSTWVIDPCFWIITSSHHSERADK